MQTLNRTLPNLANMETTTGNPIIQRPQCTVAINMVVVLPTLHAHFESKTTQTQNPNYNRPHLKKSYIAIQG